MKNTTIKTLLFALVLLFAMSACTDKSKDATGDKPKSDSAAQAKADSTDAAEAKDVKEALDAVKK